MPRAGSPQKPVLQPACRGPLQEQVPSVPLPTVLEQVPWPRQSGAATFWVGSARDAPSPSPSTHTERRGGGGASSEDTRGGRRGGAGVQGFPRWGRWGDKVSPSVRSGPGTPGPRLLGRATLGSRCAPLMPVAEVTRSQGAASWAPSLPSRGHGQWLGSCVRRAAPGRALAGGACGTARPGLLPLLLWPSLDLGGRQGCCVHSVRGEREGCRERASDEEKT